MNPEKTIQRLNEIETLLSNPELDVKTALELFEEGVQLIKQSYEEIKQANGKVVELKRELDKYTEIKFDEE